MTTKKIRSKYHWHTTFAKRNQSALYADRFQSSFWHILIGKSPMLITLLSKWWQILAIIQIWWLSPSQLQKMETQINHIPKSTIYKISPINPPLFSDHQLRSTSRSCRSAARSCRNSERKPGLLGGDIDMARVAADTSLGGFFFRWAESKINSVFTWQFWHDLKLLWWKLMKSGHFLDLWVAPCWWCAKDVCGSWTVAAIGIYWGYQLSIYLPG